MGEDNGWYVPSSGELNLMYTNLHLNGLGNFAGQFYWSSSQSSQTAANTLNFGSGGSLVSLKTNVRKVRRIKAF